MGMYLAFHAENLFSCSPPAGPAGAANGAGDKALLHPVSHLVDQLIRPSMASEQLTSHHLCVSGSAAMTAMSFS